MWNAYLLEEVTTVIILPEKAMGLIIKLTCIAISSTAPKPASISSFCINNLTLFFYVSNSLCIISFISDIEFYGILKKQSKGKIYANTRSWD